MKCSFPHLEMCLEDLNLELMYVIVVMHVTYFGVLVLYQQLHLNLMNHNNLLIIFPELIFTFGRIQQKPSLSGTGSKTALALNCHISI